MQGRMRLAGFALDSDKAGIRTLRRLADGGSICPVVPVAHDIWLDELRGDQPDVMTHADTFPAPVVRSPAGLHGHRAGRQADQIPPQLIDRHLAVDTGLSGLVNAMHMDRPPGQVNANTDRGPGGFRVIIRSEHGSLLNIA